MIEKKILANKIKKFEIQDYVRKNLKRVGLSDTDLQMTPLGEKVIIKASRPGLIVGRKGQSIKRLTASLKKEFKLENPQIEIAEVPNVNLDANIVAERIANSLERYGSARFKGVGHKALSDVMNAGALGVEILISGKIPSSRAKRWRFYQGYLKKSGDVSLGVLTSYTEAQLKTGTIGIQVRIMPPDLKLPDKIKVLDEETLAKAAAEEQAEAKKESEKKAKKSPSKKKTTKKSSEKKAEAKTEEKPAEPAQESEVKAEAAEEKKEAVEEKEAAQVAESEEAAPEASAKVEDANEN